MYENVSNAHTNYFIIQNTNIFKIKTKEKKKICKKNPVTELLNKNKLENLIHYEILKKNVNCTKKHMFFDKNRYIIILKQFFFMYTYKYTFTYTFKINRHKINFHIKNSFHINKYLSTLKIIIHKSQVWKKIL